MSQRRKLILKKETLRALDLQRVVGGGNDGGAPDGPIDANPDPDPAPGTINGQPTNPTPSPTDPWWCITPGCLPKTWTRPNTM
jgi:hypothetical protein